MSSGSNVGKVKGRREIAIKNKHLIITLLTILTIAIVIGGGGIIIYNYGDKIAMLKGLENRNKITNAKQVANATLSQLSQAPISVCGNDIGCINKIAAAKAVTNTKKDLSPDFCNSLNNPQEVLHCENQYYKEKAINTQDYKLCSKIKDDKSTEEYCYYTVYVITHNKEICQYLKDSTFANNCQ